MATTPHDENHTTWLHRRFYFLLRVYSHQKGPLVHLFGPHQERISFCFLFFSFGGVLVHAVLFASELYSENTSTRVTIGAPIGQKRRGWHAERKSVNGGKHSDGLHSCSAYLCCDSRRKRIVSIKSSSFITGFATLSF